MVSRGGDSKISEHVRFGNRMMGPESLGKPSVEVMTTSNGQQGPALQLKTDTIEPSVIILGMIGLEVLLDQQNPARSNKVLLQLSRFMTAAEAAETYDALLNSRKAGFYSSKFRVHLSRVCDFLHGWPGCRRSCLLATQRCRTRRPPKQVVSRRLDRWYRPIGLRAQVPSPWWSCHHIHFLHRVAMFLTLGATQWKIPTWQVFRRTRRLYVSFLKNPLYQKPPGTTSIVLQKGINTCHC